MKSGRVLYNQKLSIAIELIYHLQKLPLKASSVNVTMPGNGFYLIATEWLLLNYREYVYSEIVRINYFVSKLRRLLAWTKKVGDIAELMSPIFCCLKRGVTGNYTLFDIFAKLREREILQTAFFCSKLNSVPWDESSNWT